MTKRMLIDATHPEETRVAAVSGNRLDDFDFEIASRRQLKGNIYLAKVTRVEPSLQAAFVEYGGNRHGFLAFSEIHPDYYRIPIADREALLAEEAEMADSDGDGRSGSNGSGGSGGSDVEVVGGDDIDEGGSRRPQRHQRRYKIQEVIKRRQILLVQVTKEERGNKGAALTTYLSLAGRYCVLMPNSPRGGGVSRKITNPKDRKRLKEIITELDIPSGMSVILRTAGLERSKVEIKRDLDYLLRQWDNIRALTLESIAPALIYEEGNLIKRAIRDLYTRDVDEILVSGDDGYRTAKDFMRMLMPSHAKRVQPYRDASIPLFFRYQVESQIDAIHSPVVQLKSGGYIVINPTEALVAIDVNSGRSTRERNIEETAYKTNLEAAEEIARQLRLRDLAGLIVIDFIDMDENRNDSAVERRLKEAMKTDRARIQIGRISPFGLLELSRQRLRPSLIETSFETCQRCTGTGLVRTVESSSLQVLRAIEEEGIRRRSSEISVFLPANIALYILNQKRNTLMEIEARYGFSVSLEEDSTLHRPDFRIERVRARSEQATEHTPVSAERVMADAAAEEERDATEAAEPAQESVAEERTGDTTDGEASDGESRRRRRGRRRRKRPDDRAEAQADAHPDRQADGSTGADAPPIDAGVDDDGMDEDTDEDVGMDSAGSQQQPDSGDGEEERRKRRRRGKRGGRRRSRQRGDNDVSIEAPSGDQPEHVAMEPSTSGGIAAEASDEADADAMTGMDDESSVVTNPYPPLPEGAPSNPAALAESVQAATISGQTNRDSTAADRGQAPAATSVESVASDDGSQAESPAKRKRTPSRRRSRATASEPATGEEETTADAAVGEADAGDGAPAKRTTRTRRSGSRSGKPATTPDAAEPANAEAETDATSDPGANAVGGADTGSDADAGPGVAGAAVDDAAKPARKSTRSRSTTARTKRTKAAESADGEDTAAAKPATTRRRTRKAAAEAEATPDADEPAPAAGSEEESDSAGAAPAKATKATAKSASGTRSRAAKSSTRTKASTSKAATGSSTRRTGRKSAGTAKSDNAEAASSSPEDVESTPSAERDQAAASRPINGGGNTGDGKPTETPAEQVVTEPPAQRKRRGWWNR